MHYVQNFSPSEEEGDLDSLSFLAIPTIEKIMCEIIVDSLREDKDKEAIEATRWWWRMRRKHGELPTWHGINGGYNVREYKIGRDAMFLYVWRERRELLDAAKEKVLSVEPTAQDKKWLADWEEELAKTVGDSGVPGNATPAKTNGIHPVSHSGKQLLHNNTPTSRTRPTSTWKPQANTSDINQGLRKDSHGQLLPIKPLSASFRNARPDSYNAEHEPTSTASRPETLGAMLSVALSLTPDNVPEFNGSNTPLPGSEEPTSTASAAPKPKKVTFAHPHNGPVRSPSAKGSHNARTDPRQPPPTYITRGTQTDQPRSLLPRPSLWANRPLPPMLQAPVQLGMQETQLRFLRQALEYCGCQPSEIDIVEATVWTALWRHQELRDR